MQQTEMFLAAAAESLAHASQVLNTLSINTKDNVDELELRGCGLESEAKMAMQQYLSEKEGKDAAAEDFSLCHIYRDKTHLLANIPHNRLQRFSFDAAFVVDPPQSGDIWVGVIKAKLTGADVIAANQKKQELHDYISCDAEDVSDELEIFQRQAAHLKFLKGRSVKLFIGGAEVTSEAEAKMHKTSCIKLLPNGARFDVVVGEHNFTRRLELLPNMCYSSVDHSGTSEHSLTSTAHQAL